MDATSRLLSVPEQRPARQALERIFERLSTAERGLDDVDLIVLHGPAGCGKSRLIQTFVDDSPASISVVAAEASFKPDRSAAGVSQIFDPEREPDLLVVEDLQFLAVAAVETFVERLDQRRAHGLPTIVTASAGPRHLRYRGERHAARLTSRLAAGLVIAVPNPQSASRRMILAELLHDANVSAPETVIDFLAAESTSFRSLIGAVNQLELLSRLESGPMKAAPLLEHFRQQTGPAKASIERIVQRVAGCFDVTANDVRSRSRRRGLVVPRHVSMYLARRLTPLSLQQIGGYFGGCDHATVLHACRKMEATLERDPQLGGTVQQLQDDLA